MNDKIVEAVARARHDAWEKEWTRLGANPESWEELSEDARAATIRVERAAIAAYEAEKNKQPSVFEKADNH